MEKPNDKTPEIPLNIFLHTFFVIPIPILHHSITPVLILFHHSNTPSLLETVTDRADHL